MAETNCWLQDTNVQGQLEEYFTDVDRGFSRYYETNVGTAEQQLDGHLAARLEREDLDSLKIHLERVERVRRAAGMKPFRLSIKVTHVTTSERTHGADIGLVAHLALPEEYELTKAVLVQSKRLYPSPLGTFSEESSYEELFKNQTKPQWERMLSITPASAYFLYNPHELRLKKRFQVLGTRVIPAQHIAGIAKAMSARRFTALDAYQKGKHLPKWLVEDFICCRTGDTREEVIKTALGRNPDFSVPYTIQIMIHNENADLNLWDQRK